MSFLLSNP